MFLRKDDFFAWLDEYTRGKRNDLQRSQTAIPKRSEKIVLNLTTAPLQPVQINIPFKSVTFIQANISGAWVQAKVEMLLDSASTGNEKNAVSLNTGDTFNQDQTVSRCFLRWDAQPGVQAELIFLEDSQLYKVANTVTVGNVVQVQGTVEVVQLSDPWTVSITGQTQKVSIAEIPRYTLPFNVAPGTTNSWNVPSGEYWKLNISVHNPNPCPANAIVLDGVQISNPQDKGFWAWEWNDIYEGNSIDITSDVGSTGFMGFFACYKTT